MPETTSTAAHSCPYAVALSDNDEASQKSEKNETSGDSLQDILHEAKTACPAFAAAATTSSACPFSSATSATEIRQTLLQVPPSHVQQSSHSFAKALQHLHSVSGSLAASTTTTNSGSTPPTQQQYVLPGGCPVQTLLQDKENSGKRVPFVQAMEEWSLAAIMAKMAEDLLENEEEQEDPQVESKSQSSKPTIPTLAASAALPTPSSTSLSQALKSGTAASHEAAENVHFVKNFIVGKIDRGLYKELVLKLYHVYDCMEDLLDHHASQHFGACHFPKELNRKQTLLEDVDYWHGEHVNLCSDDTLSSATRDYVDRLQHIAATQPLLLLSHAYTRYLGDLSGGKILARVARRALHLSKDDHEGLAFYEFEHIQSAKVFKDKYRRALDEMKLSDDDIRLLVREANIAFLLNMRLFEELDVLANVPGARVRSLEEVLEFDQGIEEEDSNDATKKVEKCPFANLSGGATAMLPNPHASARPTTTLEKNSHGGGRCPWPFVFFHDPWMGLEDYQTWVVVGLVLAWLWSSLQNKVGT